MEKLASVEWTQHVLAVTSLGALVYGFVMGIVPPEIAIPLFSANIAVFVSNIKR